MSATVSIMVLPSHPDDDDAPAQFYVLKGGLCVHSRGLDATRRCAAVVELLAQVEHACGSCLMSPGLAASRVTWSRGCGL